MTDKWSPKDPGDTADYFFNMASLLPVGVTISNAVVTPVAPITLASSDFTASMVRARLAGGVDGTSYDIQCVVVASDGQIFREIAVLKVKGRRIT